MEREKLEFKNVNARITRFTLCVLAVFLLMGFVFPSNWKEMFGIWGDLIAWSANTIPTLRMFIAKSPMGELIQGYFGVMLLMTPFLYIFLIRLDNFSLRYKVMTKNKSEGPANFLLVYLFYVPLCLLLLYLLFDIPLHLDSNKPYIRGQNFLWVMISFRWFFTVIGSIVMVAILFLIWTTTIFLFWPFSNFFNNEK
jgi:hypothetical protein